MRAAAEVGERAVAVERDASSRRRRRRGRGSARPCSPGPRAAKRCSASSDRTSVRSNGSSAVDVLPHPLLDPREVLVGDLHALRELEVVVEAVLDRRADRDLGARIELHHGGRHHVRGVVADQVERLGAAVRDDLDPLAVRQRRARGPRPRPSTCTASAAFARPGPDRARRGRRRWRRRGAPASGRREA